MTKRQCAFRHPDGRQCGAPPLRDGPLCRMHDPEYQTEVQEARRLGGIRKRREVTIQGAYDLDGITTVEGIQRLVDIAIIDALGLDSSIPRCRLVLQAAQVAAKLLETGDLQERVRILEAAVLANQGRSDSVYDQADDFDLAGDQP
jgi:hypothetical protein